MATNSFKSAMKRWSGNPVTLLDRLLSAALRHNAGLMLFLVCCGVGAIGVLVIRDLQAANGEAQKTFSGSVRGLQRIGELQYDAQETRRATLYALTTSDSNLQVVYADQSRDADRRVKDGIAEYGRAATEAAETELANRLARDWARYLSVRDEVLASILEGSTGDAVNLDLSGGVPAFERVRQDLIEVKRLYGEEAARREASLDASSRRSSSRLIGILIFTFLLSSAAVWAIQRSSLLNAIQLARLQMEFVASVSHELRTPLSVLSSAADNLADGLVEGKAALQRYGAILQHQSRSMGKLVDEILLFASTEDQRNRYVLQPLQIAPVIEAIVASAEEQIQGAKGTLEREIEPDLPLVMGNIRGITQCVQNLIGNAVKYGGSRPRVVLRAYAAALRHGASNEVQISVTDRGIGIDSSELGRIFEPFYRSPGVLAAQIHGTGLGLALAKRIAESMGGSISVVSELSLGSTFTLHLETAKGDDEQKLAPVSGASLSSRL